MSKPPIQVGVKIEGGDALLKALRDAGLNVKKSQRAALRAAAKVIGMDARTRAPGPGVKWYVDRAPNGNIEATVKPDAAHWYYRFFETGVQPFEINFVTGRSTRTSGGGRAIRHKTDASVMKFGDQFASIVRRGGMPARPFLRPAFDTQKDAAVQAFGDKIRAVLEQARAAAEAGE
jgi:HK97 gp10 family phage protein